MSSLSDRLRNLRPETADYLINGIYPLEYVTQLAHELEGIVERQAGQRDAYWWASTERYGSVDPLDGSQYLSPEFGGMQTFEMLEVDLGRVRQINYLALDVLRAPLDISIEYDASSTRSYNKNWRQVTPTEFGKFDSRIYFEATARNPWFAAEFYFGDTEDRPISTRYLRITFTRRTEHWPAKNTTPFRWPVLVKSTRTARYVRKIHDALGLLIEPSLNELEECDVRSANGGGAQQFRQRFAVLAEHIRGDITPDIYGLGFFANVVTPEDARWQWDVYDVTDSDEGTLVRTGNIEGAPHDGDCWINIYFDRRPIDTNIDRVYELRINNLNPDASPTLYCNTQPFSTIGRQLPGSFDFVNGSTTIAQTGADFRSYIRSGTFIYKGNDKRDATPSVVTSSTWNGGTGSISIAPAFTGYSMSGSSAYVVFPLYTSGDGYRPNNSLAMRVWADIADSGRDVIGNSYRSAVLYDHVESVFDETKAGWLSAPQPSPEAVEALYLDVRDKSVATKRTQVIDAIRVAPRTPGVFMHIYYSTQNLQADRAPDTQEEWDAIEWTPVNATYVLRFDELIELPRQIQAAYIKLEFTNLQPLPIKITDFPRMLPVRYRRYPSWVESQFMDPAFSAYRRTVEDWFVRSHDVTGQNVLRYLTQPVKEFEYKQREFLTALASGHLSGDDRIAESGFIDLDARVLVDPVTSSKISFKTNDMYQTSLLGTVDRSTILGTAMAAKANIGREQLEVLRSNDLGQIGRTVSTVADRVSESYSYLAQTPMWFNRRCLHFYRTEIGAFGGKPYFAGVKRIQLFRNDYTVTRDDLIIEDILHDSTMLDEATWGSWIKDEGTNIPEALPDGLGGLLANVWATYTIGDLRVTDEPLGLAGIGPRPLTIPGVATDIELRSAPAGGGLRYVRGDDYDINFHTDSYGRTVTSIARSLTSNRIIVPHGSGLTFNDGGGAIGIAQISGAEDEFHVPVDYADGSTITGAASPSAVDTARTLDAGTVTGIASTTMDSAPGHGVGIVTEYKTSTDAGTVTGNSVITTTDVKSSVDAGTVTGNHVISAVEFSSVEAATVTGKMVMHQDYQSIVDADSPVAYWPFQGVVNTYSSVGNMPGAVVSGAMTGSPRWADITVRTGAYSSQGRGGIKFLGGSGGNAAIPNRPEFRSNDFSIEIWYRVYGQINGLNPAYLVHNSDSNDDTGYGLYYVSDRLWFTVGLGGGSRSGTASLLLPYPGDRLQHAVATYNSSTGLTSLYMDGALAGSATVLGFVPNTNSNIVLANNTVAGTPSLMLSDFAYYSSALSQAVISKHYLAGIGENEYQI